MKKILAASLLLLATLALHSQTAREEVLSDVRLSACSQLAYPGPRQHTLTSSPKGKTPFYLSHYGRHGSRYVINPREYDYPYFTLLTAEQEGKLSTLGLDVLRRLETMRRDANRRHGELTLLGTQQTRNIGRRMVERFPEIFADDARVTARSTTVIRCILSMENTLQQMLTLNPQLVVDHDASLSDMDYLNHQDPKLFKQALTGTSREVYDDYCRPRNTWQRLTSSLFTDTAYVSRHVDGGQLVYYLYRLASNLQNTELRRSVTLYDLFTDQELWHWFQKENVWWYLGYGFTPLNGSQQPFLQRHLLRRLITEADSCLAEERPGATLRFGHETVLLPLVCLMGVNGYDLKTSDLSQLDRRGWLCYRVFPMGANLQLVFYRSSIADRDVLLKVLLNENEATLPVKTDCAPYYHWADVKDFLLKRLSQYPEPAP